MTGRLVRISAVCLVAALSSVTDCLADDAPSAAAVLPPQAAPYFQRLLPPSPLTNDLSIDLSFDRAVYHFRRDAAAVDIELRHPSTCAAPDGPLCVAVTRRDGRDADALAAQASAALVAALHQASDSPEWVVPVVRASRPSADPPWLLAGECFYALLGGGVLLAIWSSRRRILSRQAVLPAVLVLLAFLIRLAAHPGPSDIRGVLDDSFGARRAGWVAVLHCLHAVLPRQDATVWMVNRVVGALSVALLYVVMARRIGDRIAAVAGAAALAFMPLIARFSASDTPYILLCAALLGAVAAWDAFVESASVGTLALSLGLLTMAMQLRPEGPWLIVPAALLAIGRRGALWPDRHIKRAAVVACAMTFLALNALAIDLAMARDPTGQHLMADPGGQYLRNFVGLGTLFGSPLSDPDATPRLLAGLIVAGALAAAIRDRTPGRLWLAAVLIALPLRAPATGGHGAHGVALPIIVPDDVHFHQYANARYHLPAMYLACGLAGLGTAVALELIARFRRRTIPAAELFAVGLVGLAALPRVDLLQRMWTPQREYELFREGMARVDPQCRIVTFKDVMDAGFVPFDYLVPGRILDVSEVLQHPLPAGCVVYYRCANCYALDLVEEAERPGFAINPACRALEERFQLEPIVEAQVPALAFRGEAYGRDPLPLGFYRLHEVTAAGNGTRGAPEDAGQRPD